ncbi:MAG: YtfJ family protein [Bacteroidia bacterium]|jgi:predicted transcriptional regulator|nr:YtfJ family protein [Bacteroidia bacterium]
MKKSIWLIITILCLNLHHLHAQTPVGIGSTIAPIIVKNTENQAKPIPFVGEKVLAIFYTDPDVKDINDQLSNAIKAKNFPAAKYQGIGIGNCADTWIPDALIRMKAKQKQEQFPGSVVLLDTDHVLSKAWGLRETNETGVFIIIGRDRKVKFISTVRKPEESKALIKEALKVLEEEINKF